ncbi:MAG: type 3 dihydrofolate reductase [Proteobacteria bacterium]|nr:MAG: type 3 dihydrofolate reductase [Pseudomonadota bacterium]
MIISMIVAMAEDRVIGLGGGMPWHLPADLAHFKHSTMGCPVIMGRKTYDSIGRPLPGRRNIILSRDTSLSIDGCEVMQGLCEALDSMGPDVTEIFIIGGQQLYEQALPIADRLYLTHISLKVEGDTHFPDYMAYQWKQLDYSSNNADEKNPWPYAFELLEKHPE